MSAADAGLANDPPQIDPQTRVIVDILRESKGLQDKGEFYPALLALTRDNGLALTHTMGQVQAGTLHALLGKRDFALEAFSNACVLAPRYPEAQLRLGQCLLSFGRTEESLTHLNEAIALQPDLVEGYYQRALALATLGRFDEALSSLEIAIKQLPDFSEARRTRIKILKDLGRLDAAIAAIESEIDVKPDDFDLWLEKGFMLFNVERYEDALAAFDRAAEIDPGSARAHNNRGITLSRLHRYIEAMKAYQEVIRIDPQAAEAYSNQASILSQAGLNKLAMEAVNKALAIRPDLADAYLNRGMIHLQQGGALESRADFERVLKLRPNYAPGWNNLGMSYWALLDLDSAVKLQTKALEFDPNSATAMLNRGIAKLTMQDFTAGWRDWEARWQQKSFIRRFDRKVDLPRWHGEPLAGKRLLVVQEQAHGDYIQFSHFLRLIPADPDRITLFVERRMHRLLRPGLEGIKLIDDLSNTKDYDYHIYLLSVPGVLGLDTDSYEAKVPYISAEPDLVTSWRKVIGDEGFKIGVCWEGSPDGDPQRSIPLKAFRPLTQIPGVRLISLQKLFGLEQLESLPEGMQVETLAEDLDPGPDAFIDTAAIIANLDLVVSSDTAVVHLAGAMNHPVWVALRHAGDWRWFLDREDSPWYPSVRLFRQPKPGDWDSVMSRIAETLKTERTM
ncbi:MAG: tetratricopeptide repeat protein [Pseudomonadota bacterium]